MITKFDGDNLVLIPENDKEVEALRNLPMVLQVILAKYPK